MWKESQGDMSCLFELEWGGYFQGGPHVSFFHICISQDTPINANPIAFVFNFLPCYLLLHILITHTTAALPCIPSFTPFLSLPLILGAIRLVQSHHVLHASINLFHH